MSLKTDFVTHLNKKYPALKGHDLDNLISENLLSPAVVKLPKKSKDQVQKFAQAIFKIRNHPHYVKSQVETNPGNYSILMSYDFHLDENQNLKLIEINTNASFFALGLEFFEMMKMPRPFEGSSFLALKDHILEELKLFGSNSELPNVSIIDEEPEKQRLYVEFLVFNEVFRSFGWQSKIEDVKKLSSDSNFIYNRYTDFFLKNESSLELLEKFRSKAACFSPNPFEYSAMADKKNLFLWRQGDFQKSVDLSDEEILLISQIIPKSESLKSENKEMLWEKRKHLFFKPATSFGSKSSFKGSSISRKMFDSILNQNLIAQEYVEAPRISIQVDEKLEEFKYDLRFYFYKDRVDFGIARVYQGQVTNLQTPLGGFAPIVFN